MFGAVNFSHSLVLSFFLSFFLFLCVQKSGGFGEYPPHFICIGHESENRINHTEYNTVVYFTLSFEISSVGRDLSVMPYTKEQFNYCSN